VRVLPSINIPTRVNPSLFCNQIKEPWCCLGTILRGGAITYGPLGVGAQVVGSNFDSSLYWIVNLNYYKLKCVNFSSS
jgi:hypothetical protein